MNEYSIVVSDYINMNKEDLIEGTDRIEKTFTSIFPEAEFSGAGSSLGQDPEMYLRDVDFNLETELSKEAVEVALEGSFFKVSVTTEEELDKWMEENCIE